MAKNILPGTFLSPVLIKHQVPGHWRVYSPTPAIYTSMRANELPTMPVIIMVMGNPTDTDPQLEFLVSLPSRNDLETLKSNIDEDLERLRFCPFSGEEEGERDLFLGEEPFADLELDLLKENQALRSRQLWLCPISQIKKAWVFPMLRCPCCLGTEKTEDRDQAHLFHLARCDGGHAGSLAQNKSLGGKDGVSEREAIQLGLKVFHLFFISYTLMKEESARTRYWQASGTWALPVLP
ncbi:hypothetical protein EYF80_005667 [Liparis tanakae]|uniref:Uncharacterized protein n=1 Tax=Liparis tanakae TaxID=230148 RepID=A0A4Z2J285_9TELE|nr:hypothetical protein EYF80_005667 [Liparis tanakae]